MIEDDMPEGWKNMCGRKPDILNDNVTQHHLYMCLFGNKLPFTVKFTEHGSKNEIDKKMVAKIISALRTTKDMEKVDKLVMALGKTYSKEILDKLESCINGEIQPVVSLGRLNRMINTFIYPPFWHLTRFGDGINKGYVFATSPRKRPIIFANFQENRTDVLTKRCTNRYEPLEFEAPKLDFKDFLIIALDYITEEWSVVAGGNINDTKFDMDKTIELAKKYKFPVVEGGIFLDTEYAKQWVEANKIPMKQVHYIPL